MLGELHCDKSLCEDGILFMQHAVCTLKAGMRIYRQRVLSSMGPKLQAAVLSRMHWDASIAAGHVCAGSHAL